MRVLHTTLSIAGAAAVMATFAIPSSAIADVVVYRPRPVYVAPARVMTVAPACVTRTARVWVDGRTVTRTVRSCR
jgi:hypothetical protein